MKFINKKSLIFLLSLAFSAVYSYKIGGLIFAVISVLVVVGAWAFYFHLEDIYSYKKIEEYLDFFSEEYKGDMDAFEKHGKFFFRKRYCDGWIDINAFGLSLKLRSAITIPWSYIKNITLIKLGRIQVARIYFLRNDAEKNELFIQWHDSFKKDIPDNVLLIDSRKTRD